MQNLDPPRLCFSFSALGSCSLKLVSKPHDSAQLPPILVSFGYRFSRQGLGLVLCQSKLVYNWLVQWTMSNLGGVIRVTIHQIIKWSRWLQSGCSNMGQRKGWTLFASFHRIRGERMVGEIMSGLFLLPGSTKRRERLQGKWGQIHKAAVCGRFGIWCKGISWLKIPNGRESNTSWLKL